MVENHGTHTHIRRKTAGYVHKVLKLKKNDLNFFPGVSRKGHWRKLLGSYMQNFIEVAGLENCQIFGNYRLEGERKKHDILNLFRLG